MDISLGVEEFYKLNNYWKISFLGLLHLQFLIACSMQNGRKTWEILYVPRHNRYVVTPLNSQVMYKTDLVLHWRILSCVVSILNCVVSILSCVVSILNCVVSTVLNCLEQFPFHFLCDSVWYCLFAVLQPSRVAWFQAAATPASKHPFK